MAKYKKNGLMDDAKDTMKLGMVSMAGHGALGAIVNVPGMPAAASTTAGVAGVGLTLVNVGQLAKTGLNITKILDNDKKKKKYY